VLSAASGWKDTSGNDATGTPTIESSSMATGLWIDVTLDGAGNATVNAATLGANDMSFTGAGTEGLAATWKSVTQIGPKTYRYAYTGQVTTGTVNVSFNEGAWSDSDGNTSAAKTQSFKTIAQAQSFFISFRRHHPRPCGRFASR